MNSPDNDPTQPDNKSVSVDQEAHITDSTKVDTAGGGHLSEPPAPLPTTMPMPPESPPAAPERIRHFCILRELGKGAFGRVVLARDENLDRLVAIKILPPEQFQTAEQAGKFLREARLVAGLDHPGIVTVYEVGELPGKACYIVMKYVDGGTLAEYAQRRHLQAEQLAELLAKVADALHYAHRQEVVHRDVKPANILVSSEGTPMLADFGVALHENFQRYQPRELVGSYAYMAPEQVRGESHRLDGRADIWALGVILYCLLTHRRPFHGDTKEQLFDEIENRSPKPPRMINDGIPPALEQVVLRCLEKDVNRRYTNAGDVARDLRHHLAKQTAPPVWPRRAMLIGGIGAAAAATFFGRQGLLSWRNDRPVPVIPRPRQNVIIPISLANASELFRSFPPHQVLAAYDESQKQLQVSSRSAVALRLASTDALSYKFSLTCDLQNLPETQLGSAGIVFGYHQIELVSPGDHYRYQTVQIERGLNGRITLARSLDEVSISGRGRAFVRHDAIAASLLPAFEPGNHTLEIVVGQRGLEVVSLDGVEAPSLVTSEVNEMTEIDDYQGHLGVVSQNERFNVLDCQLIVREHAPDLQEN